MANNEEPERALEGVQETPNLSTVPSNPAQPAVATSTSTSALPSAMGDPEGTTTTPAIPSTTATTTTTTKKAKKWPAYFFPSLATQRMSFCLDVLKREDIKSVS